MNDRIASAVFDSREEAQRALTELRSAGIRDEAISIVGRGDDSGSGSTGNFTSSDGGGNDTNEGKGDVVKGAAMGAGAGALLGIAALAIPGVGPLVAAGAIASSAIPAAAAIGGGAGLAAGSLGGLLSDHGVDEEDSRYYEDRLNDGGIFISVKADDGSIPVDRARDILFRNGGHSASRTRTSATA